MKLVRIGAIAFVALSAACASKQAPPPAAPPANVVSTTHVNAAVWEEEATPRVGKPQRSDDASTPTRARGDGDSLESPKAEPRRQESRRGGFSGWK